MPHHKTVTLVNNFLMQTAQFLNRFASICEEKLEYVSNNLRRLEITTALLEAKLGSIAWLSAAPQSGESPAELPPTLQQPSDAAPAPAPAAAPAAPTEPSIQEHPEYKQYFRMVRVGVPTESVKAKMEREGKDPSALDNPDAPISQFGLSIDSMPADE